MESNRLVICQLQAGQIKQNLKDISPHTSETCAQETHGKRVSIEHTPTVKKRREHILSQQETGEHLRTERRTVNTWYITS